MYKKNQNHQFSLGDFNQPMGLKLDPENKWIKKATMIPWDEIEEKTLKQLFHLSVTSTTLISRSHIFTFIEDSK